jgi:hypothetical protein
MEQRKSVRGMDDRRGESSKAWKGSVIRPGGSNTPPVSRLKSPEPQQHPDPYTCSFSLSLSLLLIIESC